MREDDTSLGTAKRLAEHIPEPHAGAPENRRPACTLHQLVGELHSLIGSDERYALLRVRANDFEVRTFRGQVGRGTTPADAIAALIDQLLASRMRPHGAR